jgi:hypothetical protein
MESEIAKLYFDAIEAFAATLGIDVAVPNEPFTPTKKRDAMYLRVDIIPIAPIQFGVTNQSGNYHSWLLQTSVNVRDDSGSIPAKDVADQLSARFPFNYKFNGFGRTYTVMSPATIAPPIVGGGWFSIPVTTRASTVEG